MTKIQWTEETWNPLTGCKAVSEGCTNCYAARMAWRLAHNPATKRLYEGTVRKSGGRPVWTGETSNATLLPGIGKLASWRKPRLIFVCSMSDLFFEGHDDRSVISVIKAMRRHSRHTFQVLTKRPERMKEMFARAGGVPDNVWIGVSVEDQEAAYERIPVLLTIPAKVRFVSCEPLLGPINLERMDIYSMLGAERHEYDPVCHYDALRCRSDIHPIHGAEPGWGKIDWVIVGGESGQNARGCNILWIADIVKQCRAAGVPVFVKQIGGRPHMNGIPIDIDDKKGGDMREWPEHLRVREWPRLAAR